MIRSKVGQMTGTWQCGANYLFAPTDLQMTLVISYVNSTDNAAPTPIISIDNSLPVQGWIQDFSF